MSKLIEIELTEEDARLVLTALETWEKEPSHRELLNSMLGAVLFPGDKDDYCREAQKKQEQAEETCQRRKVKSLPLRARIVESINRAVRV